VEIGTIPGLNSGTFSGAANTMNTLVDVFSYVVVGGVIIGLVLLITWFVRTKVTSYNIPVKLKFEVGGSILEKKDKIKIRRYEDKWEIQFKKNTKLIAEVPPDGCAYFINQGLRTIKMFEGFVRDGQVAWIYPHPETKYPLIDKDNKVIGYQEQFITIPANLVEFQIAESRRNEELAANKPWWKDPTIIAWGAMGFMVIALIFIYLLYKSVPDQINSYLSFAKSLADNCQGIQIK
jgi:uncharacterized membrane protein YjfL (UPF0719 family)